MSENCRESQILRPAQNRKVVEEINIVMARFNVVLLSAKELKGGKHKIRIAVAHRGETRYIPTEYILDSIDEFDAEHGLVIKRGDAPYINKRLMIRLLDMRETFDELNDPDMYTCSQLVTILKRKSERRHATFEMAFNEYMGLLNNNPKASTIKLYGLAKGWLERYFKSEEVLLETIRPLDISNIDGQMRRKGLAAATIKTYMSLIKVIIDFGKKMKYVEYEVDPFEFYSMPSYEARDLWYSIDEVKRIRDTKLDTFNLNLVRDIWLLIFYLGGINIGDLLGFNFKDKAQIKFRRQKTTDSKKDSGWTIFDIQPEAQDIIKKYMQRSGRLHFGNFNNEQDIVNLFFREKERMQQEIGLEKNFIMTSARKTFSQIGYDTGESPDTIDYCLGHAPSKRMAMQYIKIRPEIASACMRRIFDRLKEQPKKKGSKK